MEEIEYKEKPNIAVLLDFLIKKGVTISKIYDKCMNPYEIHTDELWSVPPATKNTVLKTIRNTKSKRIQRTFFFNMLHLTFFLISQLF